MGGAYGTSLLTGRSADYGRRLRDALTGRASSGTLVFYVIIMYHTSLLAHAFNCGTEALTGRACDGTYLHRGMEALTALTRWDEPPYGILNYGTEALAG